MATKKTQRPRVQTSLEAEVPDPMADLLEALNRVGYGFAQLETSDSPSDDAARLRKIVFAAVDAARMARAGNRAALKKLDNGAGYAQRYMNEELGPEMKRVLTDAVTSADALKKELVRLIVRPGGCRVEQLSPWLTFWIGADGAIISRVEMDTHTHPARAARNGLPAIKPRGFEKRPESTYKPTRGELREFRQREAQHRALAVARAARVAKAIRGYADDGVSIEVNGLACTRGSKRFGHPLCFCGSCVAERVLNATAHALKAK